LGSFHFTTTGKKDPFLSILAYQTELLKDPVGADVTLCVDTDRIPAHRVILSRIPYFKILLHGSFSEACMEQGSTCHSVTLEDVEPSTIKRVLHYVYTDDSEEACEDLKMSESMALISAANMYELPQLQEVAENVLYDHVEAGSQISPCKVIDALQCSVRYSCAPVREAALNFIQCNFAKVAKEPCFFELATRDPETYSIIVDAIAAVLSAVRHPRHS